MKRFNHIKNRVVPAARALARDAKALLLAARSVPALLAPILLLLPAAAGRLGPEWLSRLANMAAALLLTPLFAAMAAVMFSSAWERRPCPLKRAAGAVRGKILRVLATGLCVWAGSLALDLVTGLIGSLAGLLNTLTGWIPGVGAVVGALGSALLWLAMLAQEFIAHTALVCGMAALMAEGLWALPQARRALVILWGGRTDSLPSLGALFAAWIAARAAAALIGALAGGPVAAIAACVIDACLTAVSAAAVMAVYLRERDRQGGWTV